MLTQLFCSIAAVALAASGPAPASTTRSQTAAYLGHALELIRSKHLNVSRVDWRQIEATARSQSRDAKTTAETYPAIREVLQSLGEKHSFLVEPQGSIQSAAVSRPAATATLRPKWRSMLGKIGAIWLPGLNTQGADGAAAGAAYTAAVQSGLREMDESARCGWLVDLRQNYGGDMWPMLQGLDPLLGDAPFGYFVRGNRITAQWTRTAGGIGPSKRSAVKPRPAFSLTNARAPIAVLVGPQTTSSGEMVAIALRGRSDVRFFGASTAGFTTANERFPLSDGATLVITTMTVRDRLKRSYQGALAPDENAVGDLADMAAVKWLETACGTEAA